MTSGRGPATIDRRTLLALFAGSGLGLLVGCSPGPSAEERACERVQGAIPEVPAGLLAIGSRYLELHPDDDVADIGRDLPGDDQQAVLAAMAERVRADFDAGRVVSVDGWMLARTEARAAAVLVGC